jgi:hypothetical protein
MWDAWHTSVEYNDVRVVVNHAVIIASRAHRYVGRATDVNIQLTQRLLIETPTTHAFT